MRRKINAQTHKVSGCILHRQSSRAVNLIQGHLIKRHHIICLLSRSLTTHDLFSRADSFPRDCDVASFPCGRQHTYVSLEQARVVERHDRDIARQGHPPAQNHLRRVSPMTSDFYWQPRVLDLSSRCKPNSPSSPAKGGRLPFALCTRDLSARASDDNNDNDRKAELLVPFLASDGKYNARHR